MPLEDFLQYCPAKHGSCRPSHRQGRAVHRVLDGNRRLAEDGNFIRVRTYFRKINEFILHQQTPIKGPIHNYDPHNFDDVYADEYGGFGSGMNTGNFRNGGSNDRGRFNDRGGNANRFNDGGNRMQRGGFNDRRANGSMDRGGRGNSNGGMRDYVDPWAHSGGNGAPMMGSGAGPLNSFGMGNNANGNGSLGGNMNLGNANQNNNGGGQGFASNLDIDKTSTQVTIPKDVSVNFGNQRSNVLTFFRPIACWRNHRKGRRSHPQNPLGVECVHSNRRSPSGID